MLNGNLDTHEQILDSVWSGLREGVKHGAHPFHTPVLATTAGNEPDARTVVLRLVDKEQRRIFCHTDARSPKVSMLQCNPRAAWLFYDRKAKIQLRLYGEVSVLCADAIAKSRWEASTPSSRHCYLASHAPGRVLPADAKESTQTNDGFNNFAVISAEVSAIDWLFLRAKGHQRVRFDWVEGQWKSCSIAP